MKKFTKICLIICGALAAVGLILCIAGAGLGFGIRQFGNMVREGAFSFGPEDWDVDIFGNQEKSEEDEDAWAKDAQTFQAEEVRSLELEFDFGTLVLETSDSDQIEVSAEYRNIWNNYTRSIQWKIDGSTLKIKDEMDKKILKLFTYHNDDATLTIRIPEGKIFDEMTMDIGAAEVRIETALAASDMEITLGAGSMSGSSNKALLLEADELVLDIGAGQMELSGIRATELDVDCGTGQMELENVTAQNVDADCGVGQLTMEMTGQQEEYNYEVDCGIGRVVVGDSSYSGLGSSKQIRNGGNKNIDLDCGVGEIKITFEK